MAIFCKEGRGAKKGLFSNSKKRIVSSHKRNDLLTWNDSRRAIKPFLSSERGGADTCSDNESGLEKGLK